MKLWQLKKISSGEALNDPQPLPENWGPIFGLSGIKDRLGDLSWLGPHLADQGWFEVGEVPDEIFNANLTGKTVEEIVKEQAKAALAESDWTMLPDVPLTVEQKSIWLAYRKGLREIHLQPGFPSDISWPAKP